MATGGFIPGRLEGTSKSSLVPWSGRSGHSIKQNISTHTSSRRRETWNLTRKQRECNDGKFGQRTKTCGRLPKVKTTVVMMLSKTKKSAKQKKIWYWFDWFTSRAMRVKSDDTRSKSGGIIHFFQHPEWHSFFPDWSPARTAKSAVFHAFTRFHRMFFAYAYLSLLHNILRAHTRTLFSLLTRIRARMHCTFMRTQAIICTSNFEAILQLIQNFWSFETQYWRLRCGVTKGNRSHPP